MKTLKLYDNINPAR